MTGRRIQIETKTCEFCGRVLPIKPKDTLKTYTERHFCNRTCKREWQYSCLSYRHCKLCNKPIPKDTSLSPYLYMKTLYCSTACKTAANPKLTGSPCCVKGCINPSVAKKLCWKHYRCFLRYGDPLAKKKKRLYPILHCKQCNEPFNPTGEYVLPNKLFCNGKCYGQYIRDTQATLFPEKHCEHCNSPLVRKIYACGQEESFAMFSQRRFCNRKCSAKSRGNTSK